MRQFSRIVGIIFLSTFITIATIGGCNSDSSSTNVSQIGELTSVLSDDIADRVNISPYEGGSGASVILQGSTVLTLTSAERSGLKATHEAGYTIVLLDASKAQVDELHEILGDGTSFTSGSDPTLLGYSARKENVFTDRQMVTPLSGIVKEDSAYDTAANMMVNDLLAKPGEITTVTSTAVQTRETTVNVADKPVSVHRISDPQPNNGAFNTTVKIYALYQCQKTSTTGVGCSENPSNLDQYFITAEADWTPGSGWQSSDDLEPIGGGFQKVRSWEDGTDHCKGDNNTACRYANYPRFYELEMEVPSAPSGTVFQADAAPSSTAGKTTTYTSGFTFNITGEVNISGDDSLTASATWQNTTSTTTPPLTVDASNTDNEGAKWEFIYSPITIEGKEGPDDDCEDELTDPQNGQTPDGKFSNAVQTVVWTSCPTGSEGFDVKVEFVAHLATTETLVWPVEPDMSGFDDFLGGGTCEDDFLGNFCDCKASNDEFDDTRDFTYTIKSPSTDCSGS